MSCGVAVELLWMLLALEKTILMEICRTKGLRPFRDDHEVLPFRCLDYPSQVWSEGSTIRVTTRWSTTSATYVAGMR